MNRRFIAMAVLAAALLVPRYARGHEGHIHKVMGTVAARDDRRLEVKAANGKLSTITVDQKTRILRGKTVVPLDDINPGERLVVSAVETKAKDGKTILVAKEVKLGTVGTTVKR